MPRRKAEKAIKEALPCPAMPEQSIIAKVAKEEPRKQRAKEVATLEFVYVLIDELQLDWDVQQSVRNGIARRLAEIKLRGW